MRKIKVLHTTMSLNIGGAETHIVELAKYLNGDTYEVQVASNGGVYEKVLHEAGITHHQVPLHTKNPLKVLAAYRKLRRIVKEERIDIVHAHARIPAFVAGFVCGTLGKSIVTTTHFPFKVNYILRRLTNWGHKSIAVSEDLKAYLQKEYDYNEKDVYVSVNGIDTEKFKSTDHSKRTVKNIVQVSRLDGGTSLAAEYLIEKAPDFYKMDSGLRVVIVGGGTELERLRDKASRINKEIGLDLVRLTGPVSDVPGILNETDIFVGISRSALEAMCYEVPVVLAGNYGMYGFLDKKGLAQSEPTNFTCRGEAELTKEGLYEAVAAAWQALDQPFDWTRAYIQKNYSVARMVAPYVQLYEDLAKEPKKYVLAGYYGYSNSGDDALLASISYDLTKENPDNEITILTKTPDESYGQSQVKTIYRFNLIRVLRAIKRSDILLMGGGSLLQDKTSSRSLWYYLGLIGAAAFYNRKCYLFANGIGPIQRSYNRWLTRRVVDQADLITLREAMSRQVLETLGVTKPYMEVTADPVFNLVFDLDIPLDMEVLPKGFDPSKPFASVIVRSWEGQRHYVKELAKACDLLVEERGLQVLMIPLKYPSDLGVERKIDKAMNQRSYVMDNQLSMEQLVALIGKGEITLAMRLHGIIYSAVTGVPVVGLSYDMKVAYYTRELGMPLLEDVTVLTSDDLAACVSQVYDNYETLQQRLNDNVNRLTDMAGRNAQLLRTLF